MRTTNKRTIQPLNTMKIAHLIPTILLGGSLATGLHASVVLHSFDFDDTAGTTLQAASNTGTVGGAFSAWNAGSPTAATTVDGTLRLTNPSGDTRTRLNTGNDYVQSSMTLYQTVTIAGWNMSGSGSYVRLYFMNALSDSTSTQITTELRFNVNTAEDGVDFVVGTGGTGASPLVTVPTSYGLVQTVPLTFRTEFNWSTATASFSQLMPDDTWQTLASNLTVGTSTNPPGVRDALSSQIRLNGTIAFFDIDSFSVTAVPEPRTYAMIAGLAVLALAGYRRLSAHRASPRRG